MVMRAVDNVNTQGPISATSSLAQLDMATLLAQPLHAVVDAQTELSLSTIKFIKDFAIDPSNGGTSLRNVVISQDSIQVLRDDRGNPILDPSFGQLQYVKEQNVLNLPFITLLNVPALQIKKFTIDLTIELVSVQSISGEYTSDLGSGYDSWSSGGGSAGIGSYRSYAKGTSSETSSSSSNQAIKYSLHLEAAVTTPPGLTLLMDFLIRNKMESKQNSNTGTQSLADNRV